MKVDGGYHCDRRAAGVAELGHVVAARSQHGDRREHESAVRQTRDHEPS